MRSRAPSAAQPTVVALTFRSAVVVLAASGAVLAALAGFGLGGWRPVAALILALALTKGAEIGAVAAVARRFDKRLAAGRTAVGARAEEMIRSFSIAVTANIAAAAVLVGPTALMVAAVVFRVEPQMLVRETVGVLLATEAVMLLPALMATRAALRTLLIPDHPTYWEWARHGSLGAILLPVIAVSAVAGVSALAYKWGAMRDRIVDTALVESHRRAVLAASAAESGRATQDTLASLTRYDLARTFFLSADGVLRQGVDRVERALLEKVKDQGRGGAVVDREANRGVVWMRLDGTEAWGGLVVDLPSLELRWAVVALLLAATALASVFVAWRHGGRLAGEIAHVARRLDAVPDGEADKAVFHSTEEVEDVKRALDRLVSRFIAMRGTQQHAIESERQARERKAHLFAGMSHDLRSPLNSIIGFTDLLLKGLEGPLDEEQRQAVLCIAEESEALMVLIADILDSSKMEAGRLDLVRAWTPSVEVLTECATEARKLVGTRPIEIVSAVQPGLPPVFVDKGRIHQAIISLLARAVSAVRRGSVRLKASLERGDGSGARSLRIDIIDPGRVISAEERARITAAFRSEEDAVARGRSGGLGIGIALARDIVRLHGGRLIVGEEGDEGTVFSIVLPLDEPPAAR